ncbi:MAG: peptide ABC transporter substrate-binding protein [Planctomycetia bacterium]|nr:peptide ABC transporter substrate-binding protein [Planctomycetia bacterium]
MTDRNGLGVAWCAIAIVALLSSGCSSQPPTTTTTTQATEVKQPTLQTFDPPPLEKLLADHQWIERPVVDSLKLRREFEKDKKPLVSVAEALAMKNDSDKANEKIVGTLGLLPKDDSAVDFDASIVRRLQQEPKSLNPILTSSMSETEINNLTAFGLFSFDWQLNPFASWDTVKSWKASDDNLVDIVVMRDDLTWSDGKPITAHDVVYSFQTIMDPNIDVPAQRSGTDKIRWVHAYDNHTVAFFHKEPLVTNVWNVNFAVIPKHVYEPHRRSDPKLERDLDIDKQVVGGAYGFASRTRGQELVLQRRESYYRHNGKQVRDKPYFQEIRFKIMPDPNTSMLELQRGGIAEAELSPGQWQEQTNDAGFYQHNTKVRGSEWTFFYFGWNFNTPYFSDLKVRQAMSYAFHHDEMLKVHCYGLFEPCTGIFHPESWMMASQPKRPPQKQDLDKAEDLLDAAGWEFDPSLGVRAKTIGGKKVPFKFTMLVRNSADRVAICELLKQNLQSIGVEVSIAALETATLQQRLQSKQFEANFGGWGTGADPDTSENIWGSNQERNWGGYSNPKVDQLFADGRKENDRQKRGAIYAEIDRLTYDDQVYTFLYYQPSLYAFSKDMRGYMFSPRGPFHYGPGFSAIWQAAQ